MNSADVILPELTRRIRAEVRAGRLIWNDWPTGVAVTAPCITVDRGPPRPVHSTPAWELRFSPAGRVPDMPEALPPEPLRTANPWRLGR